MTKHLISLAATLALAAPVFAADEPEGAPSPNQIVDAAAPEEWVQIPAEDLLVMTLAPDAQGKAREVVIQLMPAPFSQGWVENIRTLARAEWYDDITVNRVQENYVVQWGDPNYDNPEAEGDAKPLPDGLKVMGEDAYEVSFSEGLVSHRYNRRGRQIATKPNVIETRPIGAPSPTNYSDPYAPFVGFSRGFPVGFTYIYDEAMRHPDYPSGTHRPDQIWPVHCYGMVGVGRGYSPDTGSGAELYVVNGHAPRHLDRNIALAGRIVSGMEHLSSLPRGSGALGFYTEEEFDKRTPILTVRVASDLPAEKQPRFEFLDTDSETFARYVEARANRRDPFFIHPAGGADICNIPIPVRPEPNG